MQLTNFSFGQNKDIIKTGISGSLGMVRTAGTWRFSERLETQLRGHDTNEGTV